MLAPSALRSSTRGVPGLLLAALFLALRLLASSMAMAAPVPNAVAGAIVICHTGLDDDAPPAPGHDPACLVCPACHVVSEVGLPMSAPAVMPEVVGGDIGRVGAPPGSTGPPRQPRVTAYPTGPPVASI
ncbi:MAG: hypothetical protein ACRYF2_07925 [Janthinobacterium lividum]